ncbi:MAG: hypothetical protein EON58_10410 [Alphaproteobacteria bacterium]|nr:MAG: hypothetical protein EON58_10410 [Alphaproteobacteria bacterium]
MTGTAVAAENTQPKKTQGTTIRDVLLGGGAVVCFLATLWLAITDKASSATVTGILTIGLAAFRYLPLIDTLEVFGLKAKLKQTVDQADDVLAGLRSATSTASRLTYFQLAYIGRMASPTWSQKRRLLAEVDAALAAVGDTESQISAMREPIIRFALTDLYYLFTSVLQERVRYHRSAAQATFDAVFGGKPIDPADPEYIRLNEARRAFADPEQLSRDIMSETRFNDFTEALHAQVARSGVPPIDQTKLQQFALRVGRIGQRAWDARSLSDEVFELVKDDRNPMEDWKRHYEEAFGEKPRALASA